MSRPVLVCSLSHGAEKFIRQRFHHQRDLRLGLSWWVIGFVATAIRKREREQQC